MGQTTAFRKEHVKSSVLTLGDNKPADEVRYIHGTFGEGTWTFYGGHDPEDYRHHLQDPPTDLSLHPNSPGYRLILNKYPFSGSKKETTENIIGCKTLLWKKLFHLIILSPKCLNE